MWLDEARSNVERLYLHGLAPSRPLTMEISRMKTYGKKLIGVGVATLVVTSAAAFNASAATTYKSYAEAQYIAGSGALGDPLGNLLLGGLIEGNGAKDAAAAFARVDSAAGTPETVTAYNDDAPLAFLDALTGPVGDLIGGVSAGVVGVYANADKADSVAAAGAVSSTGAIVNLDTNAPEGFGNLKISLTGPGAPLEALNGLANVTLDLGALSSRTAITGGTASHQYAITDGGLTIQIPLLGQVLTPLLGLAGPTGLGGTGLIGGLDTVIASLSTLTGNGLVINLSTGTIQLNIDDLLKAVSADLNNLPPNSQLLPIIINGVINQLPVLISNLANNVVPSLGALTVAGIPLGQVLASPLGAILQPIVNGVVTPLLQGLAGAITGPITQLFDALSPLLSLRVNVQETNPGSYRDIVAGRLATTQGVFSTTALRLGVLGTNGSELLALNLGNSLVGPNSSVTTPDTQAPSTQAPSTQAPSTQAPSTQAPSTQSPNVQAQGGFVDSPVDTLPSTGAANLTPFWLLGLALLAIGAAVLLNEKRRSTLQV